MRTSFKTQKTNRLRGFTLIELLVVVTIIVVLSGLTIGVSGWVQRKSAASKARTQMELIMMKIAEYGADNGGVYPEKNDSTGMIVYTMLFGDGVGPDGIAGTSDDTRPDGKPDEGAKVYLAEFDPNANSMKLLELRSGSKVPTKLVDPFGKAWRYRSGARYRPNNPDFDFWSEGPDGKNNTDDDIVNW